MNKLKFINVAIAITKRYPQNYPKIQQSHAQTPKHKEKLCAFASLREIY
ncbi:hypothetical protein JYQ62_13685 [Nostoc sp. UHCC 0702]|nr:hypothetical protein JYQ62_13685 [Nostoc sp. UHCC 0702]